jgi:phage terminase Nu1 subunit (DNA packaging protein)
MSNYLYPLLAERKMRPSQLAKLLGVEKSTVTRWDDNGIPLKRVFEIEKETGIPREKLSPKYFARARQ